MSNILRLESKNVKRIKAVEIEPGGASTVVIGGKNGQGKTSVLDSIEFALGGRKTFPHRPIRDGADGASVVLELDDLIVTRKFKGGIGEDWRSTVTVESKEGAVFRSPQTMLDKLIGKLSFDPLAFVRMSPKEQSESLRELVGVDTSELDDKRADLYTGRSEVNREIKHMAAEYQSMTEYPDAPETEINISELLDKLDAINEKRYEADKLAELERKIRQKADDASRKIDDIDKKIEELVTKRRETLGWQESAYKEADELLERFETDFGEDMGDPLAVREEIDSAEEINVKVRNNLGKTEKKLLLDDRRSDSKKLTEMIEDIDEEKRLMLADIEFPVEGLSFSERGVTFGGVPFDQASSAEQLRVSVAMGLALNPKLKVVLIRDGSLLDEDSLAMVSDIAAEAGAQVWIEMVSTGDEVTVIIEDGMVKGNE
jgi:DNA repair exonuclease SbcCD ATPase subunit